MRQFCKPSSQAELGFQQALASLLKQKADDSHSTLLTAAFVAKYSCSGPYPLEDVLNVAADLVHHGTVLRTQLAAALSAQALAEAFGPATLLALSSFSAARLWNLEDLLQVLTPESPVVLARALLGLLTPSEGYEESAAAAAKEAAAGDLLAQLMSLAQEGLSPARVQAQRTLESLRGQWIPWKDSNQEHGTILLRPLPQVFKKVSEYAALSRSVAQRFLLSEAQALLTNTPRQEHREAAAREHRDCLGWAVAPPRELDDAIRAVVLEAGAGALLGVLKASLAGGAELCWVTAGCIIRKCMEAPTVGTQASVLDMLEETTKAALESATEPSMKAALMLARAIHAPAPGAGGGACGSAAAANHQEYEKWFSGALSGGPAGSGGGSCSVKALLVLLRVLTALVPHDTRGVLCAQRAVLSRAARKTQAARDYLQLAQARLRELPADSSSGRRGGSSPSQTSAANSVTDEDRAEAQKRTEEFVCNSFRVPAAFLNTVRNWKKSWFEERLVPALLEPSVSSAEERDNRGKFLEALAAKHLVPSSAPRTFLRQCDTAIRHGIPHIPKDATFSQVCALLPAHLANGGPASSLAAINEVEKHMAGDLERDGSEAHVASMVDSLLEMAIASVRQGSSGAQEWHVFLARALSQQPAMHDRFWQRLTGLCRDHLKGLAPHQVQGVAGLLVSVSTLAGDGLEMRPEVSFLQPPKPSTASRGAPAATRSPPGELPCTRVGTSGAALAAEALRDAATTGLLHSPGFAASVRLCTAFVVSALKLTGRIHCGQQLNEPAATTAMARQAAAEELLDTRPAKLQRRSDGRVDGSTCREDEPPEPAAVPVRSLAVQIDCEVLHFLQWAVRQRSLQGSAAVPCFAELSPEELEEATASVKVAEDLLSSSPGIRLCEAAGPPRLSTFVWIESAAVAGGLSTSALADAAAQQFIYRQSTAAPRLPNPSPSVPKGGNASRAEAPAVEERPAALTAHSLSDGIISAVSRCSSVVARLSFNAQLKLTAGLYAIAASFQGLAVHSDDREAIPEASARVWTERLQAELLSRSSTAGKYSRNRRTEADAVIAQLVDCLFLRLPNKANDELLRRGSSSDSEVASIDL